MHRLAFLALLIAVPILLLGVNLASACWYGYGYGGYGYSSYRPRLSIDRPTYAYAGWVGVAGGGVDGDGVGGSGETVT